MDINAAEATIDLLHREGYIKNVADLYSLDFEQVVKLERFADKSARNLVESISDSINVPFPRVLYALGIRHVGETVARKLAAAFGSMEAIINADQQALEDVDEIGGKIAQSIIEYFDDPANRELIHRLRDYGLQLEMKEKAIPVSQELEGKTFVISGVFETH